MKHFGKIFHFLNTHKFKIRISMPSSLRIFVPIYRRIGEYTLFIIHLYIKNENPLGIKQRNQEV